MLSCEDIKSIEEIIAYTFKDKNLLNNAFTHSSYANIKNCKSNENAFKL